MKNLGHNLHILTAVLENISDVFLTQVNVGKC